MRVRLTTVLDIPYIDEAGDYESEWSLHSAARAYFLRQYGDARELGESGLAAFESAVLDTIVRDGIGDIVSINVSTSWIEAVED